MTLPQIPSGNDPKKYQCYVCGFVFGGGEYKEFAEHIIDEHEEGREYILCPLLYCKAPVRDLRQHFKAKHPSVKLPPGIQHRVCVWYDVRHPTKRKRVTNFKKGSIVSKKNGGKVMPYRSGYEEDVYNCLERDDRVKGYAVEPFPVNYYWRNRSRNYFPDLQVLFADGHIEIWEIKPENQNQNQQNVAKWNACRAYCQNRGWKFEVINESDIAKLKNDLRG